MPYITNSNALKIIGEIQINSLDLKGILYKINIDFFNKFEINLLLTTKYFFENPDEFFKEKYEKHIRKPDTYNFVHEYNGMSPAYHKRIDCKKLLSDYKNYKIPIQIKYKAKESEKESVGKEKELIEKYRKWFKNTGQALLETNPDRFEELLPVHFHVGISKSEMSELKKEASNTGPHEIKNIDLDTLEKDIASRIQKANDFIVENEKNKAILDKYKEVAYLWKTKKYFLDNTTDYSNEEIIAVLKTFDEDYKQPLMEDLKDYYRIKFNPKIKFKEDLLSQLGFTKCRECCLDRLELPFNINDFVKK